MPDLIRHRLPHLAIFVVVAALYWSGALQRIDYLLMDVQAGFVERDASEQVVVVAMDERSLRLLDVWPWPRRYYAGVLDKILEDGAELITVDIDFSSRATPFDDGELEAALQRGGGRIVLPVFKQHTRLQRDASSLAETSPRDRFAKNVTLGAVVVQPEADGLVRQADDSMRWSGGLLASFPALLAGRRGPGDGRFYIDYGIRPETIPSVSFVDVLRGEFPKGIFKGRRVIIGATAVELGDMLPVPRYVALPGAYVLTLSAESLIQDRAILRIGILPTLGLTLAFCLLLGPSFARWPWYWGLIAIGGWSGAVFLGGLGLRFAAPASLDLSPLLLTPFLSFGQGLVSVIDAQTLRIFRQRMAVLHRSSQMRQIVENSFDAIFSVDHFGDVTVFNSAAEKLFGIPAAEIIGRKPDNLVMIADRTGKFTIPLSDVVSQATDSVRLLDGRVMSAKGEERIVELAVQGTILHSSQHKLERREGPRSFHFITIRDITERRQLEAARQQAMEEAISANRAKTEFLAAISHELRTPLNAIIGFSEIMKDQMLGELGSEEYVSYSNDIFTSGRHLLAIVNDILDITKIDAGQRQLAEEEIDVREYGDLCIRLIRGRPEAEGLEMRNEVPEDFPVLIADAQAVRQILINLMSNAVKFTEQGSATVAAEVLANGAIDLIVRDTGIGIPQDEIENVTRPFYQVDSSLARKYEGTGLGLALVTALIELHGATMRIDSVPREGTTIHCIFPQERTAAMLPVEARPVETAESMSAELQDQTA
jgi:PAS domain S-box-containing protein